MDRRSKFDVPDGMKIAIQLDSVRQPNGEQQSFSARWIELAQERGIETCIVDVFQHDALSRIKGCDGFLWRYGYDPRSLAMAKRILPAIEYGLGIPVFPNNDTSWHFEDKIAQRYLLEAASVPTPETWVMWTEADANTFADAAAYPIVVKLAAGIRSNNVILVHSSDEARRWIKRLFGAGVKDMSIAPLGDYLRKKASRIKRLVLGKSGPAPNPHHGYFYAQEFLADNAFDTRVTVVGNRAWAFRRMNRDNDFRSSGSGKIDWDPIKIDLPTVELAFETARKLRMQSVAIDGMRRGDTRLIGEVSYTYAAWAIRDCPGHWRMGEDSSLEWVAGAQRAEDAIFEDFVHCLEQRVETGI